MSIGVLFCGLAFLYVLLCFQNAAGSLMKLAKPVGACTAAYALFVLFRFRLFPAKIAPELWLYGLYILSACIPGFFIAQDRAAHVDIAMRLIQGLAMVGSLYALLGLCENARPLLWILVLGAVAYALYGIFVGFTYYRVFRQTLGNINANIFARVPLFAVPAVLGLMNEHTGWKRALFLPLLAACAYVMLVSGSRTALIACAAGVVVYIALTARRPDLRRFYLRYLLPFAGAAAVLGAGLILWKDPYLLKSIFTRFVMLFQDGNDSGSLRLSSIGKALELFAGSPVLGIGAYQFGLHNEIGLNHAHCDIAELLMAFGGLGTALYCAAGWCGARGIVRMLRSESLSAQGSLAAAMASLFVVYIVVGIADITIYEATCQLIWGGLTACGMLGRLGKRAG